MLQRLAWLWTVCLWCYKALFRRGRPTPQPQEAGHEPVAEPYTGPESAPAAPATHGRGLRRWAVRLLTAGVRRWVPLVRHWREMRVRAAARRGVRLPRLWPPPPAPRRRPVRLGLEGLEGRLVASVLAAGPADPNDGPALFAYVNTTTPDRKDFALSTDAAPPPADTTAAAAADVERDAAAEAAPAPGAGAAREAEPQAESAPAPFASPEAVADEALAQWLALRDRPGDAASGQAAHGDSAAKQPASNNAPGPAGAAQGGPGGPTHTGSHAAAVNTTPGTGAAAPAATPASAGGGGAFGTGATQQAAMTGMSQAPPAPAGVPPPVAATPAAAAPAPVAVPAQAAPASPAATPAHAAATPTPATPHTDPPAPSNPMPPANTTPAAPAAGGTSGLTGIDPTINATEGTFFNGTVAEFTDSDGNTNASVYNTSIDWGDGQQTPGMVSYANGTFSVMGTHEYAEEGSVTATTTITDTADNSQTTVQSPVTVADAGLSYFNNLMGDSVQAQTGTPITTNLGEFQDADPAGTISDYTATINWGDNTPTGTGTVQGSSTFSVSGTHTYTRAGTFGVLVTIEDAGGASLQFEKQCLVSSAALAITADDPSGVEGAAAPLTLANFLDGDGNTNAGSYTANLVWNNQQTGSASITRSNGVFQVQATPPSFDEGSYPFSLTVTDTGDQSTASVQGTVYVTDAALTAGTAMPIQVAQGNLFTGPVGSFSDACTAAPTSDFTATTNWGDGTAPSSDTLSSNGNGSFTVQGSHSWTQSGTFTITTTVADDGGSQVVLSNTATVTAAVLPVTVSVPALVEGAPAAPVAVATFTDPVDNNTNPGLYTAQVSWGNGQYGSGTVSYNGSTFVVTASPSYGEEGTYQVGVTIGDSDGGSAAGWGTATVTDAALSGTGTSISPTAAQAFQGVLGTFSDADPGGVTGDFTATVSWGDNTTSTGGTISAASGGGFQVSGGHTYASPGVYTITVQVNDAGGASTTFTTTASVSASPVTAYAVTATEGQSFSGNVADFNLGSGSYQAGIGWGDGTTTTSATLVADGNGGYYVQGTHTYSDESGANTPYTLTITITNTQSPNSNPITATGTATVSDAALSAVAGPGVTAFTNQSTGSVLLGTFTDANPSATTADFQNGVSIDWGDGSPADTSTGTVQQDPTAGFDVYGSHTYSATGSYSIRATVTDDGGQTVTLTGTATVDASSAGSTATEGAPFSGVVASFTADPSQATGATITWGDGTQSSGTINPGQGSFTVSGTHTYAEEGQEALRVTVTMNPGPNLTASGPMTVSDAALSTLSAPNVSGQPGVPLATSGQVLLLHFDDADPGKALSDYSATVAWGDNSTSTGTLQTDPNGGFDVLANHTYTTNGLFTITIKVNDAGGSTLTATSTATIGGLVEGKAGSVLITVPAGSLQVQPGIAYAATVAWGDGTNSTSTATLNGSNLVVNGTHTYQEEGSYTATATITDPAGNSASGSSSVTVGDAALSGSGTPVSAVEGVSSTLAVGSFTDANRYGSSSDFTGSGSVTIDWGDHTQAAATLTANGSGGYHVSGSHSYGSSGSFTITVTATDDGGASTSFTTTATVAAPAQAPNLNNQRTDDPTRALLLPVGEATVDLNQGAVRLSQALDFDQSPGTGVGGDPALVYNSATVSVRPIIELPVTTPAGTAKATVQLTFNGTQQSLVTYSAVSAGAAVTLAVQAATAVAQTGLYDWSATIQLQDGQGNVLSTLTPSGAAVAVVRDGSAYGAGWGIDGVSQLVAVAGGVLWVTGQGDARFFSADGNGAFSSPAEDFGTLVQNGDSTYTYTAPDRVVTSFDPKGYQTAVTTPDGQSITYTYEPAQHHLTGVRAPDGGVTSLGYDGSGLLSSITEPGGRVVQLTHDGSGNLTGITDAANFGRALGYDGGHRLTSDSWSPYSTSFGYDGTTGLLNDVNQGLGSDWAVSAAAGQGLGSAAASPVQATLTDGLQHTTTYQLDLRGRVQQEADATGAVTVYQLDTAGDVTQEVDPLLRKTAWAYDHYGDVTQATYADGTVETYSYDATFHHLASDTNADGETIRYAYNGTGDLLSATDAAGAVTQYAWSNGLLMITTDARGEVTDDSYDGDRRLIEAVDPTGAATFYQYDSSGNVASTKDALGDITSTTDNGDDELVRTVDALGGVTTETYAAAGQVLSDTNALGATESTGYDRRGLATSRTDYAQATTTDQYDAGLNLIKETDARGDSTSYTYDADNRLLTTTDALSNVTDTRTYDDDGEVLTDANALRATMTYAYDVMGRVLSETDALGRQTQYGYDPVGNQVRRTDPLGLVTQTVYDADNRVVQQVDPQGGVTGTTYDAVGDVMTSTDSMGFTTQYTYDADQRLTATVDPAGRETQTRYDPVGDAVVLFDARNEVTHESYDALGRLVSATDPSGDTTQTVYDAVGNVVESIDARGYQTQYSYDADNRLLSEKDPAGDVTSFSYDAVGNAVSSTDANGKTTRTVYDADNRAAQVLDADGHVQTTVYDAAGEVTQQADGSGDTAYTGYDLDGEVTSTTNGDDAETLFSYNADGWQASEEDPDHNVTEYQYTSDGQVASVTDPLGDVTSSSYDADNRLASKTDAVGRETTYSYDKDGRVLTEVQQDGGETLDTLSYSYDADGNVLTAGNDYGTYTYTYDASSRALTQTDPFNLTLTYGYDQNSNVTSVADSLGGTLTSVYDADSRLSSRQFSGGGAQARLDLSYTADSQVATLTRYSDTAGQNKIGVTLDSYDPAGNITEIKHENGTGTALEDFQYSYDAANRVSSETDNGTVTNYGYDKASQLTSAGTASWTYDGNGNRTNSGYATGAGNELLSDGVWNYSYDKDGNLVAKTRISTGEHWSYTYDNNNRLVRALDQDSRNNQLALETLSYDVYGQLVEQDVTTGSGSPVVTKFAFDVQGNVWADLSGSGALVMRRIYLDGPNAVVARIDSSGNVAWYLTDHLGSVRALTDGTGSVIDNITYDAWGNILSESDPANGDRDTFATMQYDAAQGDYYDHRRRYRPTTGDFESPDPIMFGAGDANLQRYVGNEPTDATDPSGEDRYTFSLAFAGSLPHKAVAVDHWEFKNWRWVKKGQLTFHFAPVKVADVPWYWTPGAFVNSTLGALTVASGKVTMEKGIDPARTNFKHFRSTPAQDRQMLKWVVDFSKRFLVYNTFTGNCFTFSNLALEQGNSAKGEPLPHNRKTIPAVVAAGIAKDVFGGHCTYVDIFKYVSGMILLDDNGKAIRDAKPGESVPGK